MMKAHRAVWLFAFGYFAAYAPYAALTKLVTSGRIRSVAAVDGFDLLPATIAGTIVTLPLLIALMGWWKDFRMPDRHIVISGIGTALIIACTTIAYTFRGVSIVLALLLMRGGVLVLAPLVDAAFGRRVRWFSWSALVLSLLAVFIALRDTGSYVLSAVAIANLGCYFGGYVLRLPCMTRAAKVRDDAVTRRYFVEEAVVALIVLGVIGLAFVVAGRGGALFATPAVTPALMIGALYSVLYVFGTLIYLDRRENTFCIPLNRSASLLSGAVAGFVLHSFFGDAATPSSQLVAAGVICLALAMLSPLHHVFGYARDVAPARQLVLFICAGSGSRAALAKAIANVAPDESRGTWRPLDLERERLTPEIVDAASFIVCMTSGQCDAVLRTRSDAAAKTHCLERDAAAQPIAAYIDTARRIERMARGAA